MLTSVNEVDPEYDALDEFAERTGASAADITYAAITVIVSAPRAVTPYHIDGEQNFLCQIRGCKDVYLYNQENPFIVPQQVIENFQAGDSGAAHYRP